MSGYVLQKEDVAPLLEGLAVLGTGGGGSPLWGKAILEKEFTAGREINIVDPQDVPDDALVVSGGLMGSVKTLEEMSISELLNKWEKRFELIEASRVMEAYLGQKIDYVIPFEVGGLNTPVIMAMAARMGIKTVDGDALGRSAPETQMTSFLAHGVSLTPMPLVDAVGNAIIVTGQSSPVFADEIGRWMVTRGGGMGANNHYPMSGATLKKAAVPNSISFALMIGREILTARQKRVDPVAAVTAAVKGFPLFQGEIISMQGEDKGGFYITNVTLIGMKEFGGSEARLVIKNETMALWVNDSLKAVFPDLVCMLDPQSGEGIMSVDLVKGKQLYLIGMPCHPRLSDGLKNSAAAEAFGGQRYGHPELKYVPMEELNAVRE
ncbi:MAG TPA: DUF917 domain-containing protein [Candidatus Limnocylindrales bacterium]|nr:DUF917 domain-containing protein [Candidatus Limnocylindrales bacterium]